MDLQSKQRLLQSSPFNQHIPRRLAERLHIEVDVVEVRPFRCGHEPAMRGKCASSSPDEA